MDRKELLLDTFRNQRRIAKAAQCSETAVSRWLSKGGGMSLRCAMNLMKAANGKIQSYEQLL